MLEFIQFFMILNHELGHAKYIEKITNLKYKSNKDSLCKPIIVIGDYNDCIGRKPNKLVMGIQCLSL